MNKFFTSKNDTNLKQNAEIQTPSTLTQVNKKKKAKKTPMSKKTKKKIRKIIIFALIALVLIGFILFKNGVFNRFTNKGSFAQNSLTTYSVSRGSIQKTLTSNGTIEPVGKSQVNALVKGKIIADYFEEGDIVEKDQLLYQIETTSDLTDLEDALEKALEKLDDALELKEKLNVKSDYVGNIEKLYFEVGDEVKQGDKIADIIDRETMLIDIPFMKVDCDLIRVGDKATLTVEPSYETIDGIVTEISPLTQINSLGVKTSKVTISVSNIGAISTETTAFAKVGDMACTSSGKFYYNDEGSVYAENEGEIKEIYKNEGSRVGKDSVILRIESESLEDSIKELEKQIDRARDNLEDYNDMYNITSPTAGTIMAKEYDAGETIGSSSSSSSSLAEIYDMSAFVFKMKIDDLDIDSLKKGQDVIITSSARNGYVWTGTITNISVQGSTENGATAYPVTVTIYNEEDPGKRIVDEDGTIHKTYKSGKVSTVKNYVLESIENMQGSVIYNYNDGLQITETLSGDAKVYTVEDKTLRKASDGTYSLNGNIYVLSDDMSTLSIETMDESNMLRPGMNVDAEIILGAVTDVITIPVSAVSRGNVVKVLKRAENTDLSGDSFLPGNPENTPEDSFPYGEKPDVRPNMNIDSDEERPQLPSQKTQKNNSDSENTQERTLMPGQYGSAEPDASYEEVVVTLGISDDNMVEITSGLNVGDIIILDEFAMQMMGGTSSNNMYITGGGMMGGGMMMGGGGMRGPGMSSRPVFAG